MIDYTKYPMPRLRHHTDPGMYLAKSDRFERRFYPPIYTAENFSSPFADGNPPALVDVGCGLGVFLLETALAEPNRNILGLEVRQSATAWIQNVIDGEKIPNVAALWYSVANGLPFIATRSIEKIFYFFPDPWVKRRHQKRRAFTPALLDEFARILQENGTLYLMTDVPDVDAYQQQTMREHGVFDFRYVADEEWDLPVKTNHERFCLKKNIPFIRMKATRKNS